MPSMFMNKMANTKLWISVTVIVCVSLSVTVWAPISESYKGITVLPAIGALLAALFQLFRDHTAQQNHAKLQSEQQLFNLGATSHMANTVFDKHVSFCEEYIAEVHQLVVTLTREGPTEKALNHASELYRLRIRYTAWITPEMNEKLLPFEDAARVIGANAGLSQALLGEDDREGIRASAIAQMYDTLRNMLDIGDAEIKDEHATVVHVQNKVREILQVDQLISIREFLIQKASSIENIGNE